MVVAACSPTPSTKPGETPGPSDQASAKGSTSSTPSPLGTGSAIALPSFGPLPSGWPEIPDFGAIDPDADLAPAPLPDPSMTEPFSIGEALYDPARVPEAVVSLLDVMGVGIYGAGGTAIRQGDVHDADDLWLREDEVRGLIEMGVGDATAEHANESGPYTFADLAAALGPMLPGWSATTLAAAYDLAYRDHPDDLVPKVMLGQPIEVGTPLTRVQMWLLFVDGFLEPGVATAIVPGADMAAAGSSWGTANATLPAIPSPDPTLTAGEWALLLAHVPVLGWTIPFGVDPLVSTVSEGVDGPPKPITVTAQLDFGSSRLVLVSPTTGRTIIGPGSATSPGGQVTWNSSSPSTMSDHGSVSTPLGVPVPLGPTGAASFGYQVRQQPPAPNGPVVSASANLSASIQLRGLVLAVYHIPAAAQGMLFGSREAIGRVRITWHAREGIWLYLSNGYDLNLADLLENLPDSSATGLGFDVARGFLEKRADGTYRGVVSAAAVGHYRLKFAGEACTGDYAGDQLLYVVGIPISGGFLQLRFYPETSPTFVNERSSCADFFEDPSAVQKYSHFVQADLLNRIPWLGGGPDNRPPGIYLGFSNSRWTNPTLGYSVVLPSPANPRWQYTDDDENSQFGTSLWYVRTEIVSDAP